jgi:hypothetical protein
LIENNPATPSSRLPLRITPATRRPKYRAALRKSTSIEGSMVIFARPFHQRHGRRRQRQMHSRRRDIDNAWLDGLLIVGQDHSMVAAFAQHFLQ